LGALFSYKIKIGWIGTYLLEEHNYPKSDCFWCIPIDKLLRRLPITLSS